MATKQRNAGGFPFPVLVNENSSNQRITAGAVLVNETASGGTNVTIVGISAKGKIGSIIPTLTLLVKNSLEGIGVLESITAKLGPNISSIDALGKISKPSISIIKTTQPLTAYGLLHVLTPQINKLLSGVEGSGILGFISLPPALKGQIGHGVVDLGYVSIQKLVSSLSAHGLVIHPYTEGISPVKGIGRIGFTHVEIDRLVSNIIAKGRIENINASIGPLPKGVTGFGKIQPSTFQIIHPLFGISARGLILPPTFTPSIFISGVRATGILKPPFNKISISPSSAIAYGQPGSIVFIPFNVFPAIGYGVIPVFSIIPESFTPVPKYTVDGELTGYTVSGLLTGYTVTSTPGGWSVLGSLVR